jgi:hypothetical protein
MNPRNRDLLVLAKKETMNQKELDREIELLNELFHLVENSNAVCTACEVIDLNRYKVIRKSKYIKQILKQPKLKPFVFISIKN